MRRLAKAQTPQNWCENTVTLSLHYHLQEAEEGTDAVIDPGGKDVSGTPPTNQVEDDEGGGQAASAQAEVEAAGQVELAVEEVSVRRLSLHEGEESKPLEEEAGPAGSEPIPTEADGEEGSRATVACAATFGYLHHPLLLLLI